MDHFELGTNYNSGIFRTKFYVGGLCTCHCTHSFLCVGQKRTQFGEGEMFSLSMEYVKNSLSSGMKITYFDLYTCMFANKTRRLIITSFGT